MKRIEETKGYGFGTFQGVFTPSILTIIGVVMYLRFGWMLGNVGLATSLVIVTLGSTITLLTGLSISALATNMRMKGGGAYFMLSRSFGIEAGAAMGFPLALAQAIGVSFYIAGFSESLVNSNLPIVSSFDPRLVGFVTLSVLAIVSTVSADIALKSQYFIMGAIAFSLFSFFMGGSETLNISSVPVQESPSLGFWPVFAVFFPAVTGILSGLGMSGDLKNPSRSIPLGTISAILTGYVIYMAIPIVLSNYVSDVNILKTDPMIFAKCAKWTFPILLGVWAATLSSAVGSFLCAPRVFQALARDRILPRSFARGWGKTDDPRVGSVSCFAIAAIALWLGDINAIAPILTMFNLSTYALLNLSAALETAMSNPSWRPTFRVKAVFSFAGFVLCSVAMFMISPGWTFVALGCEMLIFWAVKRRAMKARWGDMRTGLWVSVARAAMLKLEGIKNDFRNWRPDVLAFTVLSSKSTGIMELARAISAGRGMVTLASIVPKAAGESERMSELCDILRSAAAKKHLSAFVRVYASDDIFGEMRSLVHSYGFGPFVPDTVLVGVSRSSPRLDSISDFASYLSEMGRNAIFVREREDTVDNVDSESYSGAFRIDVWWRGRNQNGAFMLALASLVAQSAVGKKARIRLCQIVEKDVAVEEAERVIKNFLLSSRVEADTFVRSGIPGRSALSIINEVSSDAQYTFIGLRSPLANESEESYADYFKRLREETMNLRSAVFSLAANGVDFRKIYRE
jgi:amino acid transporter